jgi:hypothetical protein
MALLVAATPKQIAIPESGEVLDVSELVREPQLPSFQRM